MTQELSHVADGPVHRKGVGLVQVVERLGLTRLGREELRGAPGVLDRLPRLGEFHLLYAFVGGQERYPAAVKIISHERYPFGVDAVLDGKRPLGSLALPVAQFLAGGEETRGVVGAVAQLDEPAVHELVQAGGQE